MNENENECESIVFIQGERNQRNQSINQWKNMKASAKIEKKRERNIWTIQSEMIQNQMKRNETKNAPSSMQMIANCF